MVTISLITTLLMTSCADAQLWRLLVPVSRVQADPNAEYPLEQTAGPWLIMAATFQGDGSEQQARELALELRAQHNLKTYLHDVTLNLSPGSIGRGVDRYGAPLRMRYRSGDRAHEWAVLVGDFQAVDDTAVQNALSKIKQLRPQALQAKDGQTTQSLAAIRAAQTALKKRAKRGESVSGPMRSAFITRNPLLPKEYFAPKGVDPFVKKMNRGVEYSLLEAKGKYTVRVATFKGRTKFDTGPQPKSTRRKQDVTDTLTRAAENAHILAERMREANWEAYEFHDRDESIVTVGAFNSTTIRGGAGEQPTAEVQRILATFGAGYPTPSDPLLKVGHENRVGPEAQQRLRSFQQRFNGQHGQIASGYQPKFARAEPKNPNSRIIPFDIHPHVMEIPKPTISSSFSWRR